MSMQNKSQETPPADASLTETPSAPPTPTAVPAAARVNDEPISVDEYQAELKRYTAALIPQPSSAREEDKQTVIDDLVARLLLAQGAKEAGYSADAGALQAKIDALVQKSGSPEAWQTWLSDNQYTPESFKSALERDSAAAWMRDKITSAVPTKAAQVHGRQMLLSDEDKAKEMAARLQVGEKFETLAKEVDTVAGGDLGWFPAKYLLIPELDVYFFGGDGKEALKPGEYSPIVKSSLGYHLLETIAQEERTLSPQALLKRQSAALDEWLEAQKKKSKIEITLPK